MPILVAAMERHGHLQLAPEVRAGLLAMSAAKIPGVGPVGAMLMRMKTPAPELFRLGRQFAA